MFIGKLLYINNKIKNCTMYGQGNQRQSSIGMNQGQGTPTPNMCVPQFGLSTSVYTPQATLPVQNAVVQNPTIAQQQNQIASLQSILNTIQRVQQQTSYQPVQIEHQQHTPPTTYPSQQGANIMAQTQNLNQPMSISGYNQTSQNHISLQNDSPSHFSHRNPAALSQAQTLGIQGGNRAVHSGYYNTSAFPITSPDQPGVKRSPLDKAADESQPYDPSKPNEDTEDGDVSAVFKKQPVNLIKREEPNYVKINLGYQADTKSTYAAREVYKGYCEVCNIRFSERKHYTAHCNGLLHAQKLNQLVRSSKNHVPGKKIALQPNDKGTSGAVSNDSGDKERRNASPNRLTLDDIQTGIWKGPGEMKLPEKTNEFSRRGIPEIPKPKLNYGDDSHHKRKDTERMSPHQRSRSMDISRRHERERNTEERTKEDGRSISRSHNDRERTKKDDKLPSSQKSDSGHQDDRHGHRHDRGRTKSNSRNMPKEKSESKEQMHWQRDKAENVKKNAPSFKPTGNEMTTEKPLSGSNSEQNKLSDEDTKALSILEPLFPHYKSEIVVASVLNEENRRGNFDIPLLVQRCIEDLRILRTYNKTKSESNNLKNSIKGSDNSAPKDDKSKDSDDFNSKRKSFNREKPDDRKSKLPHEEPVHQKQYASKRKDYDAHEKEEPYASSNKMKKSRLDEPSTEKYQTIESQKNRSISETKVKDPISAAENYHSYENMYRYTSADASVNQSLKDPSYWQRNEPLKPAVNPGVNSFAVSNLSGHSQFDVPANIYSEGKPSNFHFTPETVNQEFLPQYGSVGKGSAHTIQPSFSSRDPPHQQPALRQTQSALWPKDGTVNSDTDERQRPDLFGVTNRSSKFANTTNQMDYMDVVDMDIDEEETSQPPTQVTAGSSVKEQSTEGQVKQNKKAKGSFCPIKSCGYRCSHVKTHAHKNHLPWFINQNEPKRNEYMYQYLMEIAEILGALNLEELFEYCIKNQCHPELQKFSEKGKQVYQISPVDQKLMSDFHQWLYKKPKGKPSSIVPPDDVASICHWRIICALINELPPDEQKRLSKTEYEKMLEQRDKDIIVIDDDMPVAESPAKPIALQKGKVKKKGPTLTLQKGNVQKKTPPLSLQKGSSRKKETPLAIDTMIYPDLLKKKAGTLDLQKIQNSSDKAVVPFKLERVICSYSYPDSFPDSISRSRIREDRKLYFAYGVHPLVAHKTTTNELESVVEIMKTRRVVALGKVGCDYSSSNLDKHKDAQLRVFQFFITRFFDKKVPIILHCKDVKNSEAASEDCLHLVKTFLDSDYPIVRHDFNGSAAEMQDWIDSMPNTYFSFSPRIVEDKRKHPDLDNVIIKLPLSHMLLESDSPSNLPSNSSAKYNSPNSIAVVARRISQLKKISADEVFEVTARTAKDLFKLD